MPKLDEFFAPIADTLTAFSDRFGLQLQKYYHQFPCWSIEFRHPKGGVGKIDVNKEDETRIKVWKCWWYDDYDTATRHITKAEDTPLDRDPSQLASSLHRAFTEIISWKFANWDESHSGYDQMWKSTWTKDEFEKLTLDYPLPKTTGD